MSKISNPFAPPEPDGRKNFNRDISPAEQKAILDRAIFSQADNYDHQMAKLADDETAERKRCRKSTQSYLSAMYIAMVFIGTLNIILLAFILAAIQGKL